MKSRLAYAKGNICIWETWPTLYEAVASSLPPRFLLAGCRCQWALLLVHLMAKRQRSVFTCRDWNTSTFTILNHGEYCLHGCTGGMRHGEHRAPKVSKQQAWCAPSGQTSTPCVLWFSDQLSSGFGSTEHSVLPLLMNLFTVGTARTEMKKKWHAMVFDI